MKKVLLVLVLAAILLVAVGCSSYQGQAKEPLIAKRKAWKITDEEYDYITAPIPEEA